ncbi:cyclase family protein [Haloarcula litorea]|uniref:cyclase family protein n=1 Tax=Haloarcula litorea TaxID=3032579 RepID=UPI0023E8C6B6|nr:cyclase family protein [Halomicroarcula sp. GDY20]
MPTTDLTQPVESGIPTYPGDPPVSVEPHATHDADGYRVSRLSLGSHAGTHVDAPSHTEADGDDVDDLPVGRFAGDAVVADCRGRAPRSAIGPEALPAADADWLVVHTGWSGRWGDPSYRDHPYLTRDAAAFCVSQGYDLAVDALNPDPTPTDRAGPGEPDGVPAHRELLGAGRLVVENLANLGAVPERFELCVFPLKLAGGDGSPVRAVARHD